MAPLGAASRHDAVRGRQCRRPWVWTSTLAQDAGAAAPNDYLCYVQGSSQSAQVGSTFEVPLQVEVSSTSCSDPTPDTSTSNYVTYAVISPANS